MKTILFGGSGLIGETILRNNPDIISVGRTKPKTENEHIFLSSLDKLWILDDLQFDNVIFLIGNSNHHEINGNCMMGIEYNVLPLKQVLHYMQKRKIHKFVCLTTILLYGNHVYDRPVNELDAVYPYTNDYVFSKYLAEQLVEFYKEKVPILNIRISNIYGATSLKRPDLVPTLILDALTKENPSVWNKTPIRDFIFADDASSAIIELLKTDFTGIINLGTGTSHSVGELTNIIEELSGKKIDDLGKKVTGVMKFCTNISLLQKITSWEPKYTLREGLTKSYDIMKASLH